MYLCQGKQGKQTTMAKENIVQAWLDQVNEDISAAECLFQGGHFLYVAFLCHQALEKTLKAYSLLHTKTILLTPIVMANCWMCAD